MNEFQNRICIFILPKHHQLSEKFMEKHYKNLIWKDLIEHQHLSDEFIHRNIGKHFYRDNFDERKYTHYFNRSIHKYLRKLSFISF